MSVGGQSLGKDVRLVIVAGGGTVLDVPPSAITKFSAKPTTGDEKRTGMDGEVRHLITHEGWSGSLEIDRLDSQIEDYWAAAEAAYFAGQSLPWGTIQETIQEPSGAITQWRYERVVLKVDDLGDREGNKTIKMKVSFMASRRIKV